MNELTWNCVKGIQAQLEMGIGQLLARLDDVGFETTDIEKHALLTLQLDALKQAKASLSNYKSARARLERADRSAK